MCARGPKVHAAPCLPLSHITLHSDAPCTCHSLPPALTFLEPTPPSSKLSLRGSLSGICLPPVLSFSHCSLPLSHRYAGDTPPPGDAFSRSQIKHPPPLHTLMASFVRFTRLSAELPENPQHCSSSPCNQSSQLCLSCPQQHPQIPMQSHPPECHFLIMSLFIIMRRNVL